MIPPYLTRLCWEDFRIFRATNNLGWQITQLLRYYRTQIERIQTLKLHVAQRSSYEEYELCDGSLSLARTTGALAARGLLAAARDLKHLKRHPNSYHPDRIKINYETIAAQIEGLRTAHKLIDEVFDMMDSSITH